MIKKIELIELIQDRLSGEMSEDSLGSLHEDIVEYNIGRAYNSAMINIYRRQSYNIDNYAKRFKGISVTYDSDEELYKSILPANIVQIPRIGGGIVKVQQSKGRGLIFQPVTDTDIELSYDLDVELVDDVIGYTLVGNELTYYNMTSQVASGGVKMDLVIPFEEYGYEDNVPMPSGSDFDVYSMTVEMLLGKPPADQLNNNQEDNKG